MRTPYEPRGHADPSAQRLLARALKELGAVPESASVPQEETELSLPRVIVKKARREHSHPATKADILRLLHYFGEECTYGLRTIELIQGTPTASGLLFGRLIIPGLIVLYDQAPSPWLLPGRLLHGEQERLQGAGANVKLVNEASQTFVSWPGDTLRDFMLFDVLMHEIGHHLLQHYKGKRRDRVARTKDHEAFAARFAARSRSLYYSQGRGP